MDALLEQEKENPKTQKNIQFAYAVVSKDLSRLADATTTSVAEFAKEQAKSLKGLNLSELNKDGTPKFSEEIKNKIINGIAKGTSSRELRDVVLNINSKDDKTANAIVQKIYDDPNHLSHQTVINDKSLMSKINKPQTQFKTDKDVETAKKNLENK
jgi:hypothetical protein